MFVLSRIIGAILAETQTLLTTDLGAPGFLDSNGKQTGEIVVDARAGGRTVDFRCRLNQNVRMRRLAALYTFASLLIALVYAPQFHIHESDEHGGGPLLHVHFPELEESHHGNGPEFESNHSHSQAHSVDFLTSTITSAAIHLFVGPNAPSLMPRLESQRPRLSVETPRTHDPPALDRSIPRSPPTT